MMLNGAWVDEDNAFRVLRAQLQSGRVWNDRHHNDRMDGAREALLSAGPLLPAMAEALVKLLDSKNGSVRARALALLPGVTEIISPEPLIERWRADRSRWEGVVPRAVPISPHRDLADMLFSAIGASATPDSPRDVLDLLRDGAAAGRPVLGALARLDSEWLIAHAADVVPRDDLGGVLFALPSPELRLRLVKAMAPWPLDVVKTLENAGFWESFPLAERAALRAALEA